MEENGQKSFIKPMNYEIGKTREYKSNPYRIENMAYDIETDGYLCPKGDVLRYTYSKTEHTTAGYDTET